MNFEKAARLKLRFNTIKGDITVEDLWDLPLTSKNGFDLDTIAMELSKKVKESGEESFVLKKSDKNTVLELMFDIIQYIIKIRLEEAAARGLAAINKERKEHILALIADKQDDELKGKSIEDLTKLVNELT